jgi:putative Mg2+ transporter-C (MgtC) family protein
LAFIAAFHVASLLDTFISLVIAFALGSLIGAERQYRQRTAGLRTNALAALGAAAFVDLGMTLNGNAGAVQVLAYVASGIGFLGAGVIIKDGTNIGGLNTATTLWCSAAVGACAGADRPAEAAVLTCFVLASNTFLRPIANMINRAPIDESTAEAAFQVRVTVREAYRDEVRELLLQSLEAANFALRGIEELEREGEDEVELIARLAITSAEPGELDALTAQLEKAVGVEHATWLSQTNE